MLSQFLGRLRESRGGVRDVLISTAPQLAALLAGVVSAILLARGLGPTGLGQYALVLSLAGLVTGFSDLGIGQTAIRFAAKAAAEGREDEHFRVHRWAFRIRMLLASLVIAIGFLLVPWLVGALWHAPELVHPARLSLLSGALGAAASASVVYYQSVKRLGVSALLSTGQALFPLAGIVAVASLDRWSIEAVVVANLMAVAAAALLSLGLMPKRAWFARGDRHGAGSLWTLFRPGKEEMGAFAAYMVLASILVMVTTRMDVWLMGVFLDKGQLGQYSAASRVSLPLVVLLGALNTALWPRVSAAGAGESLRLMRRTLHLTVPAAVLGVGYALFVPLLMPGIFGEAYRDGILLGQVLSLRYCFSLLISPLGLIGYSLGLVRVYWGINLIQLGVVVGLNLLLLPRIGPLASALAMLANELVGAVIIGILIGRRMRRMKEEGA